MTHVLMRTRGFAIGTLPALALVTSLSAQEPSASARQPTFRAGTTLVEVSAIVTREGVPVSDLRADEVRVLDEGVEQPLVAFEYVDLTTAEGAAQQRDFVLVIDDWHIDPRLTKPTQLVAARFIDALSPHDRLAIVTTGPHDLVQQLSTDRAASRALIDNVRGRAGMTVSNELLSRARATLGVLQRVAMVLAAEGPARHAVVLISQGHAMIADTPNLPPDAAAVRAAYLDVLRAAARADLVVYGIDPRGLRVADAGRPTGGTQAVGLAREASQRATSDAIARRYGSLGLLTRDTGGVLTVNTNDLAAHVERIVNDTRQYYRLAYAPPADVGDPKRPRARQIDVRITRPGVEVRARKAYVPG